MGRGGSKSSREGRGGGVNPNNIKNERDMLSMRSTNEAEVNQVLNVSKDVHDEYGDQIGQFIVADIVGKDSNTMAYYDGENIGVNMSYFDADGMEKAYDACVKSGFHPSKGNKTGMEAVASHEFGHSLTDAVAKKMGVGSLQEAATNIVNEARKETGHRGVVQLAKNISRYATFSNAEAVAEAFADSYCNGNNAKAESKAIMKVVNKYLKQ